MSVPAISDHVAGFRLDEARAIADLGADVEDYLPRPALLIYSFVVENGPCTDYEIHCGIDYPDGLARRAWLSALVDLGLLRQSSMRGDLHSWVAIDPEARAQGAPTEYLPTPALKIYNFLQANGPRTLAQVRKAHPLPGFGVLSWLLALTDLGIVRKREVKARRGYDFVYEVIA